uniref:Uncharacterized protein n=1 Tax=Trieres chinensis TaxID=1514140 RepID=A0A7S1ZNG9_TRICV|mmetsp:Transcript_29809/g.60908  ORF Transcript_29809/g.60908 Transcript_29809/m.60908 type:complete len:352 (+) Transcript_29809:132-1187(+)
MSPTKAFTASRYPTPQRHAEVAREPRCLRANCKRKKAMARSAWSYVGFGGRRDSVSIRVPEEGDTVGSKGSVITPVATRRLSQRARMPPQRRSSQRARMATDDFDLIVRPSLARLPSSEKPCKLSRRERGTYELRFNDNSGVASIVNSEGNLPATEKAEKLGEDKGTGEPESVDATSREESQPNDTRTPLSHALESSARECPDDTTTGQTNTRRTSNVATGLPPSGTALSSSQGQNTPNVSDPAKGIAENEDSVKEKRHPRPIHGDTNDTSTTSKPTTSVHDWLSEMDSEFGVKNRMERHASAFEKEFGCLAFVAMAADQYGIEPILDRCNVTAFGDRACLHRAISKLPRV